MQGGEPAGAWFTHHLRVTPKVLVWMGRDIGLGETEVTDLTTDDHYLWIGFAQEGLSVVALDPVR